MDEASFTQGITSAHNTLIDKLARKFPDAQGDNIIIMYRSLINFRRRIKSRLPFAGIIRMLPYSTRFQDKG